MSFRPSKEELAEQRGYLKASKNDHLLADTIKRLQEKINHLEVENAELREENEQLRGLEKS